MLPDKIRQKAETIIKTIKTWPDNDWIGLEEEWDLNLFLSDRGEKQAMVYPVTSGMTDTLHGHSIAVPQLLSEYVKQTEKAYRYVGTIWGADEFTMTGEQVAAFLETASDGEIGEHPANENRTYGPDDEGHYYLQSDGVHYVGYHVDELVLEELDF